MSRQFNGQIHVRIPPEVHEEIAREAFNKGSSISGICAQALVVRKALAHLDPWKMIHQIWESNKDVNLKTLEKDISEAIRETRKQSKA
ncbi:MAG: toxin-antitoxin system HicB family antitoxin [Deltaproteobacteria bacterium]|nr:toxin-antitoxin system HicB family antitoxin [Deltaproteobacteria bacterium]MBI3295685.1 toxin-antitoxin system HicB family antitoxin [Deltaproteobacteria bacterium]